MKTKPWADPTRPLSERLVAAELAVANADIAASRRAIMRELVNGSLEEAARAVMLHIGGGRVAFGAAHAIRSLSSP